MITRSFRTCFAAAVVAVVGVAYAAIEIRSDYPGGNVKVDKIDEAANVVVLRPDLRDTKGNWFYWDFTLPVRRGGVSISSSRRTDATTLPRSARRSAATAGRPGAG